ncbi:MAG: hypothetical protein WBC77_11535, partial [Candidatus Zixiibacteriota bacterium]
CQIHAGVLFGLRELFAGEGIKGQYQNMIPIPVNWSFFRPVEPANLGQLHGHRSLRKTLNQ